MAPALHSPLHLRPVARARGAADRAGPYSCGDIAHKLGISSDHFRGILPRLFAEFGLPAPIAKPGQRRWDRGQIDAWYAGILPKAKPANDAVAAMPLWRERLSAAYGGR